MKLIAVGNGSISVPQGHLYANVKSMVKNPLHKSIKELDRDSIILTAKICLQVNKMVKEEREKKWDIQKKFTCL